jgi:glycosyltransferase involved in cell wall biosynthesis
MRVVRYYPRALVGDGGMTSAVKRWSQGMVNCGAEAVIAFDEGVDPPSEGGVQWLPVRHAGRRALKVPIGLEEILEPDDILVLHSGWTYRNVRAAAVGKRMGVRYVLEPRGAYDPHIVERKKLLKKGWWAAWERELVMDAHAIHVFFDEEKAHLHALGYRGAVITVSNGVDVPRDPLWRGKRDSYVLWLGRFDPQHKGLDILIEAVSSMSVSERPQVRLHGPDWRARKQKVARWIADRGLTEWITVGDAAYGPAKRELLVEASGFVYPSRWDACPNSTLEAVSLGIPTLATPYPLGTYLARKKGAILAQPDAHSLADGLRRLYSKEAPVIGAGGARVVRDELGWDHVAGLWLEQAKALPG